jgi:hypothetical protein
MTPATMRVLTALRQASESDDGNGWRSVYLDNARPAGMSNKSFRSYLAKLSQHGLYRVIDGYAFGSVKMEGGA